MAKKTINVIKELPPYEKIGKGKPTTGAKPITIKIFMLILKNMSNATPEAKARTK